MSFRGEVLVILAFATVSLGQLGPNQPEMRRPLQTTLQGSSARLLWSSVVGQLQSGETRATFTALAVEDPARAGREIRGVRVAASSHNWQGTIYIEEPELRLLQRKVDLWAMGAERFSHSAWVGNQESIFSSACPGDEHLHLPLSFAYILYRQGAAELRLHGVGFPSLVFTDQTPSDVAAIFDRATTELKSH
jgi:hypothetical protein